MGVIWEHLRHEPRELVGAMNRFPAAGDVDEVRREALELPGHR